MTKRRIAFLILTVLCLSAALMLAGCTRNVEKPYQLLQQQLEESAKADTYYVKYSRTIDSSTKEIHSLNVHTDNGNVTAHKQVEAQGLLSSKYQNAYFGTPKGSNGTIYQDYDGNQTACDAAAFFQQNVVAPYTVSAVLEGLHALAEEDIISIAATQKGKVTLYQLTLKEGTSNPYWKEGQTTLYIEATNNKISKIADHETSPSFTVYITYYGPNISMPALKK